METQVRCDRKTCVKRKTPALSAFCNWVTLRTAYTIVGKRFERVSSTNTDIKNNPFTRNATSHRTETKKNGVLMLSVSII